MNLYKAACLSLQRLSKESLLGLLPSNTDTSRAIIIATGEVIDISQLSENEINPNLNNGSWVYYENLLPRRMLLTNNQWRIDAFNPKTKQVCVSIFPVSGRRSLVFTLRDIAGKF